MSGALFINMLGHGHVNPTIGIVSELMNRGENVTYIAGEEFREKIEKTGAKFLGHKNSFNVSNFMNGSLNLENNEGLIDALGTFKEIAEIVFNLNEKFDYIIYDSSFILGEEMGRVLKIPTISSTTIFAINEKMIKGLLESEFANKFKSKLEEFKPKIKEILNSPNYISFVNELQEKYDIKFPNMSDRFSRKAMLNKESIDFDLYA